MMQPSSAFLLVASLLAALPVNADGIYTKKSPVLQVTQKNYDQLIANSNHTSIVEFYAPWCGHCQNLKPAYEKAATSLDGLAKVAAVNCDEDENKPLCGRMGVQGFPTLKIVVPSKKPGSPRVEDYHGARSAKAIVDGVMGKIPNHVKRVTDKDLDQWLSQDKETPRALLFTEKGTTSAFLRSLAIDFLGSVKVGQIRNKESEAVEKFGITEFPSLVLLPGGEKEPIVYDGEFKKNAIIEFLGQVATPNPDPAPVKPKAKSSKSSKASKPSSTAPAADDAEEAKSTESPQDDVKESKRAQAPPIDTLSTIEALETACLAPKSSTCVLALLPESKEADAEQPEPVKEALTSMSDIVHKYSQRQHKLFPFYSVPTTNSGAKTLRTKLGVSEDGESIEIIALNGRRGWWRRYEAVDGKFGVDAVEAWVDAIRLGEGAKNKLPEGVVATKEEKEESGHDEL
ncbi:hypothetical protein MW887_010175 [Aspergillus wentii]|nr:hypothetical protein MW887_010175 [Aspergillus wentii]